jgi:predicted DNA-binding transcriptional regulator YafY
MSGKRATSDRADRLYNLSRVLRDGAVHRAATLAARFDVSERTIYRDMARMAAAGVPVRGTPGTGYRLTAELTLPPMNMTVEELEALHLGLAVVAEVADPDMRAAARTLAQRIDTALPEAGRVPEGGWSFDVFPFAEGSTAFHLIPALRSAVRGRAKVQVVGTDDLPARVIWPLTLEFWGRLWTCVAWDERAGAFAELRVDRIRRMTVLPATFPDMPGRRYENWLENRRAEG